jgi:RNA polymerase sigma-70 factor (ECF subfamily)
VAVPSVPGMTAEFRMRALIDTHRMPLLRFVQQITRGQYHTTEDVVQEAMIRAWRHLDRVPADEDGQRRWLFTVAHRLVIDQSRRRRTRHADAVVVLEDHHAVTDDETSLTVVAVDSLRFGLTTLAPVHREILDEIYVHNRTAHEVAERLQVPVGTVRSRAHYAIRSLRAAMAA